MQIEFKKITDLELYDKNARTHSDAQVEQILNSIKNFGFLDPIEIDEDNTVLSGHARLKAAALAGLDVVPAITHRGLSKTARRAYILAANRIAQSAGWDQSLVKTELELLNFDGFDLTITGFSETEIFDILNPEVAHEFDNDEDAQQQAAEGPPITCRGDVWQLGNHLLLCGSATVETDVAKLLQGRDTQLMVTDPPYGVEYDPAWRNDTRKNKSTGALGVVINDHIADWREAYALYSGDVAYVWHAAKFTHVVAQNLIDCGFELIRQIIWVKQNFALSRGDYHWQHESCWYVVRKDKNHRYNGARDQSSVWEISNRVMSEEDEKNGHGTQKPIECMTRAIKNNSKPNEWVYDPFGGSGTTLIACEKLERKCLMIEISEKYCDMIIRRWEGLTGKKAVRVSHE